MTGGIDSGSDTCDPRGITTFNEIRQQPELWPTTLERVASSNAHSIVHDRAAVICGAGTSAYAASAVAARTDEEWMKLATPWFKKATGQ